MKHFILIILFPLITLPALAYYNPGRPIGFVNDFAGIINDAIEQEIESKLVAFERENDNEVAVVTINSSGGDYIENFAVKLFEEWGVGKKNKDNGVLILVAVEDREMRIEVGYGLEGALTDAQSFWIIDNIMKPAFREERYGEGISEAVDKIIAATQGEYVPDVGGKESKFDIEFTFWASVFILIWLSAILGRSKSWLAGGVIGGVAGIIIGVIKGFIWLGIISLAILIPFGLLFDFIVSKKYIASRRMGRRPPWWIGGGGFGSRGGGFGGFGGGISGGGGASGRW